MRGPGAAALVCAIVLGGCSGSDRPAAEQVCDLLEDDEVEAALAVPTVVHSPTPSTPRSCSWAANGEPVVRVTVASQQWRDTAPRAPCGAEAPVTPTVLGAGAAMHSTCAAGDVAVTLVARTGDRAAVPALLRSAVSRVGSIDRAALGVEAIGPPECLEAWRAGTNAPVHCEEHPVAYREVVGPAR
jgi:hypothetical protein